MKGIDPNCDLAFTIIAVGELAGVATRIDDKALEDFLDERDPADGFQHEKLCREAIAFKRAIFPTRGDLFSRR